jgi:biopolymer transport protein ExbD
MKMKARRMKAAPTIPFIALADIAWQIVIFFILASSFATVTALKVDLPSGTNQPQARQQQEPITVMAGEGYLTVNGRNQTIPDLGNEIRTLLEGKKGDRERAVVLMGRNDLSFQDNVNIMWAIQQAGGVLVLSEEK